MEGQHTQNRAQKLTPMMSSLLAAAEAEAFSHSSVISLCASAVDCEQGFAYYCLYASAPPIRAS